MELAVTLLTILAKYGPQAYSLAVEIAHKDNPAKADYDALDKILEKRGEDYFASIPAGTPTLAVEIAHKDNPAKADYDALDKILEKRGEDYFASIPAGTPTLAEVVK